MAKRKSAKSSINKQLIIEAFAEMARQKNIDRDLLQGIIEDTFSQMVRKKYGQDSNFDIIVNMDKGDIEIYLLREVVEEVEDPNLQISLEEANPEKEEYEIGDEHLTELNLENLSEFFGRRMILMAAQTLSQRVREVERDNVVAEYSQKVGEIIVTEVYQVRRNDVYVMHNKVEMRMPRNEQIWRERYKKGESIRALLKEVRVHEGQGQPEIVISRSDPKFLQRLFEIEIPEIYDGIIEIKGIAREPGERAKVAVMSLDERVDPVGACVGMKGVRIHSIVRELANENIDVIPWSSDVKQFVTRALQPAKVKEIAIDTETRTATVVVPDDQVSLAIGKNGQNVRLAMKLTGYSISLVKEGGEDIELVEFREEVGDDLFKLLIEAEIETAKEFLKADPATLLSLEGMTPEKLEELRRIMMAEFEEDELRDIDIRPVPIAEATAEPAAESATAGNKSAEAPEQGGSTEQ
ncbi:MAG: transcription termination factor NusA [Candidatus Kapabacteria bacterium]|nr:transcription termination factor NusA [Candidatus Kapabacteria bacterium]